MTRKSLQEQISRIAFLHSFSYRLTVCIYANSGEVTRTLQVFQNETFCTVVSSFTSATALPHNSTIRLGNPLRNRLERGLGPEDSIHDKLGGNERFNCRSWRGDRGVNGARNMFLCSVAEAALDEMVRIVPGYFKSPATSGMAQ